MQNHHQNDDKSMWLKKHSDTAVILAGILTAVLWMNGKINDLDKRLVKIETILYIKGLVTHEIPLAKEEK